LNFGSRLFIEHVTNNAEGGDWQIGKQKRARSPPPLHRNEQAGRGGGGGGLARVLSASPACGTTPSGLCSWLVCCSELGWALSW
jgi:hypothetical protein